MTILVKKMKKGELNLPLIYFSIALLGVIGLVILLQFNSIPHYPCVFKLLTGHPCPTCGATRLTESVFHLKFIDAFLFNPMIFICCILFLLWGFYGFFQLFSRRKIVVNLSLKEWFFLRIIIVCVIIFNWIYLEIMGI